MRTYVVPKKHLVHRFLIVTNYLSQCCVNCEADIINQHMFEIYKIRVNLARVFSDVSLFIDHI